MSERRLQFVPVVAGLDARGSIHVYYGDRYVGCVNPCGTQWSAWLHELPLGCFEHPEAACASIETWYYGPRGTGTRSTACPASERPDSGQARDLRR